MSKKCWFAIVVVFVLAVASAIGIPALWPPTPGVTYSNFSQLQTGMTREQVEALLGTPNTERSREDWPPIGFPVLNETGWTTWQDGDDFASVHFDQENRVTRMTWNGWADERTAWEKLRDRLPFVAKKPPQMQILYIID
jgi:SmpA / OmlA family